MEKPNDYIYDAFISYPHQREHQIWVQDIFLDIFELFLTNELGYPAKLFSDRKATGSGDAWPERLKLALACSKILIPVWSINYFYSAWCMAECAVMLCRESKLSYRTLENPSGLIHPIQLFGGNKYPSFAKKIESLCCTKFNRISMFYKSTNQYDELQKELQIWANQVAESIDKAPPWMQDWLTGEWLDIPISQWVNDPSFQFPKQPFKPPSL